MLIYLKNSIITTLGAVAMTIFCASLMGYAFARINFRGRDLIFYLIVAAIFIPKVGGLMAQYEVMYVLDLRNSLLGLALLFASELSVPIFIMRQNFLGMPRDIEDAARIDDHNLYTLGVGLTMFQGCGAAVMQSGANILRQGIRTASYLVASAPAFLLYIAMQDYFVQGLTGEAIEL